jgi:hypothetical protein
MKKLLFIPLALLALASCGDDDTNIAPIEQISEGTIFGTADNPLNVGGPNQQNNVFVDLSEEAAATVSRDSWDLGFYSGSDNRVVINGSIRMAVKATGTTDISVVQTEDPTVAVGTFQAANLAYVDSPDGKLATTAFGTIATTEALAQVFIVNMGSAVPTALPAAGSANVAGDARGWKKVKIWADGAGYKLQYANLEATTATTVSIAKDPAYNHVFFNLVNGATVQAEPLKADWDMKFTTFTNEVFQGTESAGAYFYSDFIVTNTLGGVTAVKISGDVAAYDAFTRNDFTSGSYTLSTDQRAIGAEWRNVIPVQVYDNVFFVLKDGDGNLYKVKFISMLNTAGDRGFPVFQYALLQ